MNKPVDSHLLLQNLPQGILRLDERGYIEYINPAVTAITGFEPADLLNKPIYLLYRNSDDTIKFEYELSVAYKTGRFHSEGWKARRDGSSYWGIMLLSAIYNDEGVFVGFSCVLTDITEKKKNEWQLRESEEKYRLMVEGVKDYAIFMLSKEGNIISWNEGAKKTKGYSADEIIGKHFSTFYTSEDLESKKPERELKIAIATGKYEEEGWRVKKNGSVFWANIVITALFNEANQLIGFSKVTRDLSERKENEESIRQSEERYRLLVQQVADYGIFMMDEKGRIISWNEGAKNLKGYVAEEIIGKYFSIFYPEEDILNGKPAYELTEARAVGKYEEEGWRIRKDGSRFWANVVITAVYNSRGILMGYSKVTRDLTERKEAERALRESYERFRTLAEELKITNDELSFANDELEQFTSIVSHDLQEPVRTIKSFLQLIEINLLSAQYTDIETYISKAINAANRMKELIQNLLHYSQLSKGEMVMQQVSVQEIVNEALQNVKTSADASNAEITFETEVDFIEGDKVQLVQLLQNLLSNALKFINTGSPQIHIHCDRENNHVKFAVTDNGIGIQSADLNKVFEIFRRLNTNKAYAGTGIGLAICKKIVDRHHGRIWPESNPGEGTTFYFTLNEQNQKLQTA
jgi:PAS domain S-box-containing protein